MTTEPRENNTQAELRIFNEKIRKMQEEQHDLAWEAVCFLNLDNIERAKKAAKACDNVFQAKSALIKDHFHPEPVTVIELADAEAGQEVS